MNDEGEPVIKMLPPSFSSPLPPVQTLLPPIDRGDENGDEERVAFNEDEEEFDDSPVVVRERRVFPFSSIDASIFRSALSTSFSPLNLFFPFPSKTNIAPPADPSPGPNGLGRRPRRRGRRHGREDCQGAAPEA